MKKITALLVSLIMTCSVFAGCGSDNSSSAADSSSKAAASQAADDNADSKADDNGTAAEDTLAAQYTNKVMNGDFAFDATITGKFDDETPAVVEIAGGNMHMSVSLMGMNLDFYLVDGVMYTLDAETKTYLKTESEETIDDFKAEVGYGVTDGAKFISTDNTDDGLICETYEVTEDLDIDLGSGVELDESESDTSYTTTFKYYFDAETKDIVKIETITDGSTTTVKFNSFTTENVEVKLPDDFDSWTEQSMDDMSGDVIDDAELDFDLESDSAAE